MIERIAIEQGLLRSIYCPDCRATLIEHWLKDEFTNVWSVSYTCKCEIVSSPAKTDFDFRLDTIENRLDQLEERSISKFARREIY